MFNSAFDSDVPKKMQILAILRDKGEKEALRLYPEMDWFIFANKSKNYEEAKKELLNEPQTHLVAN